jgi:Ca2+-binding EF-hand superfamily protein
MKLFDTYDGNSDGRLSRFEFAEIIKCRTRITGATLPKRPDIEDIFSYLDIDGDLTISKEEFKQLTHSLQTFIDASGIRLLYRGKI